VDVLRAVLDRAPSTHYDRPPDEGMDSHSNGFTGDVTYEWGIQYLGSLFAALIEVINQHGLGDDGWKNIRWEVYDKYAKCLGGIAYNGEDMGWCDHAAQWLQGRRNLEKEFSNDRKRCDNGVRYNEMLPDESSEVDVNI